MLSKPCLGQFVLFLENCRFNVWEFNAVLWHF